MSTRDKEAYIPGLPSMLVVRDAQLTAMAALDLHAFAESVRAFLDRKYPGALGAEQANQLAKLALSTCLGSGFEQQGAIMEFAEAMLTNHKGLSPVVDLERAAAMTLREFKAREVLARLAALKSSLRDTSAAATGHDTPHADDTET